MRCGACRIIYVGVYLRMCVYVSVCACVRVCVCACVLVLRFQVILEVCVEMRMWVCGCVGVSERESAHARARMPVSLPASMSMYT